MNTNTRKLSARSDLHILRKIWHIACGVLVLGIYGVSNIDIIYFGYFCLFCAVVGFAVDLMRMNIPSFNKLMIKLGLMWLRECEKK